MAIGVVSASIWCDAPARARSAHRGIASGGIRARSKHSISPAARVVVMALPRRRSRSSRNIQRGRSRASRSTTRAAAAGVSSGATRFSRKPSPSASRGPADISPRRHHFVSSGTVKQAASLQRASECIDAKSGRFANARSSWTYPAVKKLFGEHSWAWNDNPFVGTKELDGLKIVVMLLSNWDTKDCRDVARGSNTAIFEMRDSRPAIGRRGKRAI